MIKFSMLLVCLCLSVNLLAQNGQNGIQTQSNLGVEDLVKNVFIKGNCKNVSNITAIGDDTLSIGQFNNGTSSINIEDGIILSTGAIDLAHGPNIDNESSHAFNTESNDLDLSQSATSTLFDVTGLEFDFVPLDDRVTFKYVFASEEYCEFVGTQFNDVFGFFVSGPGIEGTFDNNAINVATLIGSNENVSINTVNHLENSDFYVSNITTIDAENCELNYDPLYQDLIEYDGFTVPLTATIQVIPCETYHIRLVIGDVGDANLDSAVFLESNSFDLGEKVTIHAEVPGSEELIAYESCVDGQFVFTRSSLSDIDEDCTVQYVISAESEAINGVDFEEIPLSITIPAGDTSAILPISIIEDNMTEGPENLKLEFVYNCDCIDPVFSELIINEASAFSANFDPISVCANQTFSIFPEIIGGVPPFTFLWETGATTDTLEASVSTPTTYAVTITDFCGTSISSLADIDIQSIPTATLTGTYDFCETVETGIPIQLEGNPPWAIGYSIDGVEQMPISNIQSSPFFLNTPTDGIYVLTAFHDAHCEGNIIGSAEIESSFVIETDIIPPSCFNRADGSITITELEAIPPFSIEWNIATTNDYSLENLAEGTYTLSVIDGNGCLYEKIVDLNALSDDIKDCISIYIPNSFSPNNDGINDVFTIFFDETGGINSIISLEIYNRWGALLFEQRNIPPVNGATNWTGDFNEKAMNTGVYVYKIVVALDDGSTLLLKGDVTLVR